MKAIPLAKMKRLIAGKPGEVGDLRTQVGNIGHLLVGNFSAAGLSLLAMSFAARAMGPTQFGFLALGMALTMAIERIVEFQTWQPIIRFGAPALTDGRPDDYKALVKVAFLLDLSTAVFGWLLAVCILLVGGERIGWDREWIVSGLIYATVLLTSINGAPVGVLRLAGRFRAIAYRQVLTLSVRLALAALGFALGWGLIEFTIIWAGTTMLNACILLAAAARQMQVSGNLDFLKASTAGLPERMPGFWRFTLLANASLTVRSAPQQLDTLLVGGLVGPAAAGYFHIAKRIAKFAEQAGNQVQSVVYPDIAKLWSQGERAVVSRVVLRTEVALTVMCALGALATMALAGPAVRAFAGEDFGPAAAILQVQILAVSLMLIASTSRAGLLAIGRETYLIKLAIAGSVLFLVAAIPLVERYGPIGASYAHVAKELMTLIAMTIGFRMASRQTKNL